jgi:photosystem II protein PsbQ
MRRFRSVLNVLVVAIAIFLVSCSSAPVAKGPVYTSAQLAQIEQYSTGVVELRDRLLEIPPLVQQQDWVDVQSFIHGPLGELRARMSRLARSLEPKVQKKALDAAKEVFEDLNLIDEATLTRDSKKALLSYNRAIQDFETFLKYVPAEALNS